MEFTIEIAEEGGLPMPPGWMSSTEIRLPPLVHPRLIASMANPFGSSSFAARFNCFNGSAMHA